VIDTLLDLVPVYGVAVVFAAVALGCFGVPAPATVSLVVAGAFIASGDLALVPVLVTGFVAAIIGDQAGYWAGVSGSRWAERLQASTRTGDTIAKSRALIRRWGPLGVFLSRWLVSPLGPPVNVASGMLGMPWPVFTAAGVAGKAIWVGLFTGLGYAFSHSLATVAEVSGTIAWSLVLAVLGAALVWALRLRLRALLWRVRAAWF
jgi:membrane-associated protein